MTILSIIIFSLIGLLIAGLGGFFVYLIRSNMRQGRTIRAQLAQRVESLRMSKMLGKLGLDFDSYLHRVPLHKINESMNKCETCTTTEQCDEKLQQDVISAKEIDFCPNHECLDIYHETESKPAN